MKTDIIIIGAGPTGLMVAAQLTRYGIDFIIIDSKDGPTEQSRAIAVTARSLEIYQQMGLSDEVVKRGEKLESFNIYSNGKRKAELKIGEIGTGLSDFNFLLAFEQNKNEHLLYEYLQQHNKKVNWHTEFVSLKDNPNLVEVTAKHNNQTQVFNAKYAIACDGAKSPIRHQLQFKFEGGTYENKFFVADVIMNWNVEHHRLLVCPSDKNFCAFFPLQGKNYYRVLGTLPRQFFNKQDVAFEDIEKVVKQIAKIDITFEKVNWFSVYLLHHRAVNVFRKGNVFLAGDSAHIHSPAGGQGMNTGLQDAYNISWKLAFVLKGYANPTILDTYNEERLPFAKWLLKFTDRAFSMMTNGNWFIAKFRKYFALNLVGLFLTSNKLKPIVFKTVSQTAYSLKGKTLSKSYTKQKLKFNAGDRLPFIKDKYYLNFTEPAFHIIYIGNKPYESIVVEKIKKLFPFPVKWVDNTISDWQKSGVSAELSILLRPDNYIAALFDDLNETVVADYLKNYFSK